MGKNSAHKIFQQNVDEALIRWRNASKRPLFNDQASSHRTSHQRHIVTQSTLKRGAFERMLVVMSYIIMFSVCTYFSHGRNGSKNKTLCLMARKTKTSYTVLAHKLKLKCFEAVSSFMIAVQKFNPKAALPHVPVEISAELAKITRASIRNKSKQP